MLKPVQKLSLVVTFVPSESARPDQIADLIKELYVYTDKGTNPETAGRTAIENKYKGPKTPFYPIAHPNPPAIGRLKENIKRKIKSIPEDMLKRVIDNFSVSVTRVIKQHTELGSNIVFINH